MADHVHSDAEYAIETLTSLGGELEIGGLNIPPPTPAVIPLLQLIKSPFVIGFDDDKDIEMKDILEVLYVLSKRERAVQPILQGHRKVMLLEQAQSMALENEVFYEIYLKTLQSSAVDWTEFDRRVSEFADTMKPFNLVEAASDIHLYLNQSWMGFEMIPNTTNEKIKDTEKKTSELIG